MYWCSTHKKKVILLHFRELNKTSSEDNWMALKEKLLRESNAILQEHNLKNKSLTFLLLNVKSLLF